MCSVLDAFLLLELCRGRLGVALPDALQRDVLAPGRAHAAVHVPVRDDLGAGGVIQSYSKSDQGQKKLDTVFEKMCVRLMPLRSFERLTSHTFSKYITRWD